VDVSAVLAEIRAFRASVGSPLNQNTMRDAFGRLRAARDAVDRQVRARATGDASRFLARSRDRARSAIAQIRDGAARRYGVGDQQVTSRDSMTEVRDQLHAAGRATDMRTKVQALNAAAAAFWRGRDTGTRGGLERQNGRGAGSGAPSISEINRRNREYYAKGR
jgi:hypothetical protein